MIRQRRSTKGTARSKRCEKTLLAPILPGQKTMMMSCLLYVCLPASSDMAAAAAPLQDFRQLSLRYRYESASRLMAVVFTARVPSSKSTGKPRDGFWIIAKVVYSSFCPRLAQLSSSMPWTFHGCYASSIPQLTRNGNSQSSAKSHYGAPGSRTCKLLPAKLSTQLSTVVFDEERHISSTSSIGWAAFLFV